MLEQLDLRDWLLLGFKFSCPVKTNQRALLGSLHLRGGRSLKLGQTPGDTVLLHRFILNRAAPVNKSCLLFNSV